MNKFELALKTNTWVYTKCIGFGKTKVINLTNFCLFSKKIIITSISMDRAIYNFEFEIEKCEVYITNAFRKTSKSIAYISLVFSENPVYSWKKYCDFFSDSSNIFICDSIYHQEHTSTLKKEIFKDNTIEYSDEFLKKGFFNIYNDNKINTGLLIKTCNMSFRTYLGYSRDGYPVCLVMDGTINRKLGIIQKMLMEIQFYYHQLSGQENLARK